MPTFTTVLVNCLQHPGEVQKMPLYFAEFDGKKFVLPCNGCDWMHNSPACNHCMRAITLMFFHNPDLYEGKPITPVLPEEK